MNKKFGWMDFDGLFFSPDTGNGSGGGQAADPGQSDKGADPQGSDGGQNAGDGGKTISFTSEAELQKHIDTVLKDRLAREQKKSEEAARKATEAAEAKALADQQKWQELAEKHGKRVTELEGQVTASATVTEQLERYKGALEAQLKTVKAGLPAHVTTLLDKLDVVEQMEYIAANQEALKTPAAPAAGGPPASPKPGEARQMSEEERQKAQQQATQLYGNLF